MKGPVVTKAGAEFVVWTFVALGIAMAYVAPFVYAWLMAPLT